jgi:hypothetical protein
VRWQADRAQIIFIDDCLASVPADGVVYPAILECLRDAVGANPEICALAKSNDISKLTIEGTPDSAGIAHLSDIEGHPDAIE